MSNRGGEGVDVLALAAPFLAEFLGTAYLCIAVTFVVGLTLHYPLAPVAAGLTLVVVVASMGHVSGAHVNPAVTLAVWLSRRKQVSLVHAAGYIIAQFLAAVAVGFGARAMDFAGASSSVGQGFFWKCFAVEAIWTAALATTVLNSATNRKTSGNSFYPISIGSAVAAGGLIMGPISGGIFNPAVTVALLCLQVRLGSAAALLSAPFLGGAVAALVYAIIHRDEYCDIPEEGEPLLGQRDSPY